MGGLFSTGQEGNRSLWDLSDVLIGFWTEHATELWMRILKQGVRDGQRPLVMCRIK